MFSLLRSATQVIAGYTLEATPHQQLGWRSTPAQLAVGGFNRGWRRLHYGDQVDRAPNAPAPPPTSLPGARVTSSLPRAPRWPSAPSTLAARHQALLLSHPMAQSEENRSKRAAWDRTQ